MRSTVADTLPPHVRRALARFGSNLATARKKRSVTVAMMAERVGVAKSTYLRAERGDPTVSFGVYVMSLFVLGLGETLGDLIDPGRDEQGLLLDAARLPKRVHVKKTADPL